MHDQKDKILIVEDHTLMRVGLRALLLQDGSFDIVGEAGNGRDAIRLTGELMPNLLLMDLSMPRTNVIEAIADIKRRFPDVKVLVLTLHVAEEYVHGALKAGADGYMLKNASAEELLVAIRSVLSGKSYLSPDISNKVINGYLGGGRAGARHSAWDSVTHRERQVLKLVAEGHRNKYIAEYLCLSVKTVEKHRSSVMKKLNLHNASMLTAFAIEHGLVVREMGAGTTAPTTL